MTQILILTVGGSHQPIVSAINDLRPDFVVFVCTDRDSATGQPGSRIQIEGKGNCIKVHHNDDKPTLPNIPMQVELNDDQFEVVLTQSDNLDRIYLDCSAAIDAIYRRFPRAQIVADYTGGTKSMSAGLVMAAVESPGIDLQLVTGSRADLIKVKDGSQYSDKTEFGQVRYRRLIEPYRQAWLRYAYSEALAGLVNLRPPSAQRDDYTRFRELSRAFAEWDNFDHKTALDILKQYAPSLPENYKPYLNAAMRLNHTKPEKREAARLLDLYLNAERRAIQGRYDDAIARAYRLIEWTAQWILETQCGIKTGDIKQEQLPDTLQLKSNRSGIIQAGLFDAWQLVKHKTNGAAARFIADQEKPLLNHLKTRNGSILAHGFSPIQVNEWRPIQAWLKVDFIPMLLEETSNVGIKDLPLQLPNQYL
ncbi:MAG: TIGR02710 family CRISPR-associated protein [Nitrosomonas sp.]|nr:MAG: TIGR02710 family CRISPR-associated protein [Nitrosomonas sp.]